jgi:hypothetical protein
MSGGQKISDHGSWIGKGGKSSVLPDGVKHKLESSADGFGGLSVYEDTTEKIKAQQEMSKKKVHGHPTKPGFRN